MRLARAACVGAGSVVTTVGAVLSSVAIADGLNWAATGTTELHDPMTFGLIGLCVACVGLFAVGFAREELD